MGVFSLLFFSYSFIVTMGGVELGLFRIAYG